MFLCFALDTAHASQGLNVPQVSSYPHSFAVFRSLVSCSWPKSPCAVEILIFRPKFLAISVSSVLHLIYVQYTAPFFVFVLMSNLMVRSLFCNQIAVLSSPSFHPYSIILEILNKLNSDCVICTTPPIATSWRSLPCLSHITPFNVPSLLALILVPDASLIASYLLASPTFVNPFKNGVVSLVAPVS